METKTFTENPFKSLKLIGSLFGIATLLISFIIFLVETPQITDDGLNRSAKFLIGWWIIFLFIMLVFFLIFSFESKTMLKCDSNGCEILKAKFGFWQSLRHFGEVKWDEITDTNIVKTETGRYADGTADADTIQYYNFVVQTKDGTIDLMDLKMSSKDNIQGLINYVNEAAQQTKYIWVKDTETENRVVIDSNYGYSKVARNS